MESTASDVAAANKDNVTMKTRTVWQKLNYSRPVHYEDATFVQMVLATWASPFLERGSKEAFKQEDAAPLLSHSDRVQPLVECYKRRYATETDASQSLPRNNRACNLFLRTLLKCSTALMVQQGLLIVAVCMFRVFTAIAFWQYVRLMNSEKEEGVKWGTWCVWMWAGMLIFFQMGQVLFQHQKEWCGARLGHRWTQQAMAAAQDKLLRLSSTAFGHVSTDTIINLISNDVGRFEDISRTWVYLWAAPLEALVCTFFIALAVGWIPAIVGMLALLMVIPIQGRLKKRVRELRQKITTQNEERDRLAGEVVEGAASVKLLCLEPHLEQRHAKIRSEEAKSLMALQLINASMAAVSVFCVPVACGVTFGTAVAMGKVLTLDKVLFVIALLNLPRVWMTGTFLMAMKHMQDTLEATRRMTHLLQKAEIHAPAHKPPEDTPKGLIEFRGADFSWSSGAQSKLPHTQPGLALKPGLSTKFQTIATSCSKALDTVSVTDEGGVCHTESANSSVPVTLEALGVKITPGELVGISGQVGAGKSSILAAILGDLQPVPSKSSYVPMQTVMGWGPAINGRIAFCHQVPWIQAGTVRDNIVFGSKMDQEWYARVKTACELDHDIAHLPAADDTEVCEHGINLSGGQKARIALARAVYSQPDIILMDDSLSAVDPTTAKSVFDQCIGPDGLLRKATRVLVTHQSQWLHACPRVLIMHGGKVIVDSPWTPLQEPSMNPPEGPLVTSEPYQSTPDVSDPGSSDEGPSSDHSPRKSFDHDVSTFSDTDSCHDSSGSVSFQHTEALEESFSFQCSGESSIESTVAFGTFVMNHLGSITLHPELSGDDTSRFESALCEFQRSEESKKVLMEMSSQILQDTTSKLFPPGHESSDMRGLTEYTSFKQFESSDEEGSVSSRQSIDALSSRPSTDESDHEENIETAVESVADTIVIVTEEIEEIQDCQGSVLVQYLSSIGLWRVLASVLAVLAGQVVWIISEWWLTAWAQSSVDSQSGEFLKWLGAFSALVAVIVVLAFSSSIGWFLVAVSASSSINMPVLRCILCSKLPFLQKTPTSSILNALSKDQRNIDEQIPLVMYQALQGCAIIVTTLVLVPLTNPFITPIILPLIIVFMQVMHYYSASSKQIRRIEGVTHSQVYALLRATVKGLPTIREFHAQTYLQNSFKQALDVHGSWKLAYHVAGRWLATRLDFAAIGLLAYLLLVATGGKLWNTPLVHLALLHVLQIFGLSSSIVRVSTEAESNMTSVERMLVYTHLPQERAATVATGGAAPPHCWPMSATLEFRQVEARYTPGLPPVLKGISFTVPSGTTCGAVGRTASGKSSVLLALYELIDITSGAVLLDGIDVSKVELSRLRQQIAIIPQEPLLFSGTLRSNLDPCGAKTDDEIFEALRSMQLEAHVATLGGLSAHMAEAGGNFSAGQRQLLCLARALLSEARVLALDEATSNVDKATDAMIQSTLRTVVRGSGVRMERSMLVIAHRVDTVLDCDQLLVLADGQIVQSGRPRALAKAPGPFRELVWASGSSKATNSKGQELVLSLNSSAVEVLKTGAL